MTKASDNLFPKLIGVEAAAPGTPAAGTAIAYVKADGLWYSKDDAGVETLMSGGAGGGSVATDAIWDAAGDLAVGTGANTAARLAIGGSGFVPVSNGTTLAYGPGPAFRGARGLKAAAQTIATGTWTAVTLTDADSYDTNAYHDPGGANPERFTVPTGYGGYYVVTLRIAWDGSTAGDRYLAIYKNGTQYGYTSRIYDPTAAGAVQEHTDIVPLAQTDYVTLHVHQDSGGNLDLSGSSMSIAFVGA